jgi:tetratricopeptide (TPR) repeat protein
MVSADVNQLLSSILLSIEQGSFKLNGTTGLNQSTQLLATTPPDLINRNLVVKIVYFLVDLRPFYLDYLKFTEACWNAGLIHPNHPDQSMLREKLARVYAQCCVTYCNHGDFANAQILAERVIQLQPNSPGGYSNLGHILERQGKWPEAIQVAQKALELNPEFIEARHLLAKLYTRINHQNWDNCRYTEAVKLSRHALELNPNSAAMQFNLGLALYYQALFECDRDKFDEAELRFQKTLELQPDVLDAQERIQSIPYLKKFASKGYSISAECFTCLIPVWEKHLRKYAGMPGLQILEIGCFEGMATCWLLDEVLTDDAARITCIDIFEGVLDLQINNPEKHRVIENNFDFNIAKNGAAYKVKKIVGYSQEVMRSLPLKSYDIVYIDGSHKASDVLEDAVISWRLVKPGGLIIFDDYNFVFEDHPEWNTGLAIDAFMKFYADQLKVIEIGERQVFLEKITN